MIWLWMFLFFARGNFMIGLPRGAACARMCVGGMFLLLPSIFLSLLLLLRMLLSIFLRLSVLVWSIPNKKIARRCFQKHTCNQLAMPFPALALPLARSSARKSCFTSKLKLSGQLLGFIINLTMPWLPLHNKFDDAISWNALQQKKTPPDRSLERCIFSEFCIGHLRAR